jgi:hypothetical protein
VAPARELRVDFLALRLVGVESLELVDIEPDDAAWRQWYRDRGLLEPDEAA